MDTGPARRTFAGLVEAPATAPLLARLGLAFHHSPIPSALISCDGQVVEANLALSRLLGASADELSASTIAGLTHPDDRAAYDRLAAEIEAGSLDGYSVEQRMRRGDAWVWVELTVSVVRDELARGGWGVAHLLDLTVRRQTELQTQRFFTLAEASLDFVSVSDLDGTVRYLNRAGRVMVGLEGDADVQLLRIGDFHSTETLERLVGDAAAGIAADGYWQGNTHIRHFGTGAELPVRASMLQLWDADGAPDSVGFIGQDVSEQLRHARAMADSEARLATLLANTADIVSIVDRNATITFVNAAVAGQLGYDADDVIGRPCMEFVHPDDLPAVAERLLSGLDGGSFGTRLEARFRKANGAWKWFDVLSSPLLDTPALQGAVINLRDATERKDAVASAARRASLNALALEISRQALDVGLADLVEALPAMLGKLGALLDVGTCYIDRIDLDHLRIEPIANWFPPIRAPKDANLPTDLRELPEWLAVLNRRDLIVAEDLQRERPAWYLEKENFTRLGTRAAIICPLVAGGRLVGVLGVETANRSRHWRSDEVAFVQTVAEALANALARQQSQDELRASEERFRLLAEHATDLIMRHDPATVVRYVSPAIRSLLGYRPEDVVGRRLTDFVHADDLLEARVLLETVLVGEHAGNLTVRLRRADGIYVWTETTTMAVRDHTGAITELQSSTRDITDRKQREEELTRQALIDPLTGLANRVLLLERMGAAERRRQRHDAPFSVLLIDLDGFKEINDTYGHGVGDEVLVTLATRISSLVRQTDTVARLGGDEFVVLTTDSEPDVAMAVAERVVEVVAQPLAMPDGLSAIGASVGVAHARGPHTDLEDVLRRADEAMYRAKRAGKGRVREALR